MSGAIWLLILLGSATVIVAANWWQGFWSNIVTFVNMLLAALIATSFYRTVANAMLNVDFTWKYVVDFVTLWLLFAFSFILFRAVTESFSRIRLKFNFVVEMVGRSLFSLMIGTFFFVFSCYSLVIAPLPLVDAQAFDEKGIYPESMWADAIDYMSRNSLAANPKSAWFGDLPEGVSGGDSCRPAGDINQLKTYGDFLRQRLSEQKTLRLPPNQMY